MSPPPRRLVQLGTLKYGHRLCDLASAACQAEGKRRRRREAGDTRWEPTREIRREEVGDPVADGGAGMEEEWM